MPNDSPPLTPQARRKQFWLLLAMAVFFLVPSLYGFGGKLYELFRLTDGNPEGIFAFTPIVNYLLATLGFFCLLGWAIGQGMFTDVERPKRELLEREALLDARLPQLTGPAPRRETPHA